jgi:acetolactate synthase-1/2/3 large subunit
MMNGKINGNGLTNVERIALTLKRHKVDCVFGQSNPPGVALACEAAGIRQVGYRAENTGSYMAHGYGVCSGKIPVLLSQNGPAAALIIAGLAECYKSSYPMVVLVQDIFTEFEEKNAFQELDHIKLFDGVSKWVKRIPCKERIEDFIDMAFVAAASGRPGPAVLLIPTEMLLDHARHEIPSFRKASIQRAPLDRSVADPEKVKEAARIIARAKKPFIYAGGGVISSGAQGILRTIQEECSIPVATTTMGKGSVDEEHPLTMGPIGYYMGKRGATKFMKDMVMCADVILLVGNRTNQNGTDMWTILPKNAQYIHLDVDPMEISRNYESLRLVGDARLSLEMLYTELMASDLSKRKSVRSQIEGEISEAKRKHEKESCIVNTSEAKPLRVEKILSEMEKRIEDDHIIVTDASFSSIWAANFIKAKANRKFVFPRGIAGIGWGLPMAIGAKIAQPDRKVYCLVGDGGFAHAWSELETCARAKTPLVIGVINNSILGYQKFYETTVNGAASTAVDLCSVDHTLIARACGIRGIRVEDPQGVGKSLEEAFACEEPVLIDFIVEPRCIPPLPAMEFLDNIEL